MAIQTRLLTRWDIAHEVWTANENAIQVQCSVPDSTSVDVKVSSTLDTKLQSIPRALIHEVIPPDSTFHNAISSS